MTDKEKLSEEEFKLAEEVIKTIYRKAIKNDYSFARYGVECYQAGLKADRPKWHKVADGDLPSHSENIEGLSVYVLSDKQEKVYFDFDLNKWFKNGRPTNIIAWAEIPIYTEE